jgi:hypothetical protein
MFMINQQIGPLTAMLAGIAAALIFVALRSLQAARTANFGQVDLLAGPRRFCVSIGVLLGVVLWTVGLVSGVLRL